MIATAQYYIFVGLFLTVFVLSVVALIDVLRRPSGAFPAAGKRTKGFWGGILGAAVAVSFVSLPPLNAPLVFLVLIAAVAAVVYLVDVRPAIAPDRARRTSGRTPRLGRLVTQVARDLAPGGVLARVVRGGVVESVHLGHLVWTGTDGSVTGAVGDPRVTVFARSSLKPMQAVALLRCGWEPDDAQLALACASHSGTPEHLAVVASTLADAGLDVAALRNTPDLPLGPEAALAWQRDGHGPEPLAQNCSGKHAGMLATCVAAGWDTAGYLDPEHPLQRAVLAAVADLTGDAADHVTVDGCGAPLMSTTLAGLARAFGRIAAAGASSAGSSPAPSPEARVAHAMTARPDLVGGPGRDVTAVMAAVPGLVAKDGAEGVYAAGLPDGRALAFKVADGSARPRPVILVAALEHVWQQDSRRAPDAEGLERLRAVGEVPVLGHGRPVGQVVAALGRDGSGRVA